MALGSTQLRNQGLPGIKRKKHETDPSPPLQYTQPLFYALVAFLKKVGVNLKGANKNYFYQK
jgi:hypothetical protein